MATETTDEQYALIARAADFGVFNTKRENLDIVKMAAILATMDSATYYTERMLHAKQFTTREDIVAFAAQNAAGQGLVLEFGVASGRSIKIIGETLNQATVYGFDSFEGLPEDWRDRYRKGSYSGAPPSGLPSNVRLIVGWFDEVLPSFVAEHGDQIALLHVDCDLYSSTKTIFAHLGRFVVPGTIIHFDEYFNYPGWREHEYKAFQEFAEEIGLGYEYIALNSAHQQVTVRVTDRQR